MKVSWFQRSGLARFYCTLYEKAKLNASISGWRISPSYFRGLDRLRTWFARPESLYPGHLSLPPHWCNRLVPTSALCSSFILNHWNGGVYELEAWNDSSLLTQCFSSCSLFAIIRQYCCKAMSSNMSNMSKRSTMSHLYWRRNQGLEGLGWASVDQNHGFSLSKNYPCMILLSWWKSCIS